MWSSVHDTRYMVQVHGARNMVLVYGPRYMLYSTLCTVPWNMALASWYKVVHGTCLHGYAAVIIGGNLTDSSGCLSTLPCIDKCMVRDTCCVIRGALCVVCAA